jgi:RyR domain
VTALTAGQIAPACHEANRRLQADAGEPSPSLPWEEEPEEVRQFAIAAVEFAMRGGTPEEQFRQWSRARLADGWTYGERKDPAAKTHPCLVDDYADLPEAQRRKDAVLAAIVRAMTGDGAATAAFPPERHYPGRDPVDALTVTAGALKPHPEDVARRLAEGLPGSPDSPDLAVLRGQSSRATALTVNGEPVPRTSGNAAMVSPETGAVTMSDITPAREALEVAVCEGLGKAWRASLAHLASDASGRGITFGYPEVRAEAGKVLAAAEAWAADEVAKVADVTLARAREAEGELAALEGRLGKVIAEAVRGERARAEAAEARLADARDGIGKFLAQYGDSGIPVFKVAIDLANSLRKVLGEGGEAPGA